MSEIQTEIQATLDSISNLIDNLSTQCSNLNKDDNKDELVDIKQKIKKIENKLQLILPETKIQIPVNGDKLDRLKARAARFGALESNELKKANETEKLSKRKERFANSLDTSLTTDDAKRRRLERFAGKS